MIERKTVTIAINLFASTEIPIRIDDVNFLPDEVILKSVSCINLNEAGSIPFFMSMWSSLTNQVLFSQSLTVGSSSNQAYEIRFPMNGRVVQGSYVFRAIDEAGDRIPNGAIHSIIAFQLEFVKYS